tara:strand:+ start:25041 stop:26945 length:1905 start_codon:yes stop_codon:yes gene_type:complete
MKLKDYLPQMPALFEQEQKMNNITGLLSDMVMKSGDVGRPPTLGLDQAVVNAWMRQQMAYRQQMITDLLTIAFTIEEIRSPINRIVGEVFRKGIIWEPKFTQKCEQCGREYTEKTEECEKCRTSDFLKPPDEDQKVRPDLFLGDSNIWDNSLEEVMRQIHFDVNAVDDAFIYLVKEYHAEEDSDKIRSRVVEIRRLNPALMEFDLDEDGLPKNSHFACYIHREIEQNEKGECEECSRTLIPAMYKFWHRGQALYLFQSEVIHISKFNPSETFGWSPILTVFEKALSIRGMDSFVYRYFFERKMPSSMIMVFTDNPESLRRERENIAAKTRLDPSYVPMVAVSSRNSRGRVDMVRLFHTLQEMDYLPVRQEIRERIAAMWGVTPAWQGAPEAFGGLSTQTQQLTVMSRVVESDQRMFEDKVFPLILEAFGVTDWKWTLPQPEEKAEATRISFAQQRISAANMLFQMGFEVEISTREPSIDNVDFIISGEAQKPEDMYGGMMGGFGGAPPGMGEASAEGATEESPQMQFMEKGWIPQIQKMGYMAPVIKEVNEAGNEIWFESNGLPFIAKFVDGVLEDINQTKYIPYHRHGAYPPHPRDFKHDTMGRQERHDDKTYKPEEPEEPEDIKLSDDLDFE